MGTRSSWARSSGIFASPGAWWTPKERWADGWTADDDVPEGIRDVVRARVARLTETAGRLLVLAAVTGDEFDLATLAAAGDVAEDDVVAAIEEVLPPRS